MIDLEKIVDICVKHDLTFEECTYLYIIFHKKWKELYMYEHYTEDPKTNRVCERALAVPGYKAAVDNGETLLNNKVGLPPKQVVISSRRRRKGITGEDISSLVNRGFLYRIASRSVHDLDAYELTDKYYNIFYIDFEKHIEELKEVYPKQVEVQGKLYPLNLIDEATEKLYFKQIKGNLNTHKAVIQKIITNKDIINFKLENFIKTKGWEHLDIKSSTVEKVESI